MKFKNARVYNVTEAIKGMRNAKESWGKSDTIGGLVHIDEYKEMARLHYESNFKDEKNSLVAVDPIFVYDNGIIRRSWETVEYCLIGKEDRRLAMALKSAGSTHRKFLRQIFVSVDITAPLYWWKEMDTYKVGTVANSTSTMHTLAKHELSKTPDLFELTDHWEESGFQSATLIAELEKLRKAYLETKDERYWKELIRWMPCSWNQTRSLTMTYENILSMCSSDQRKHHKLSEWSGFENEESFPAGEASFMSFAKNLPYYSWLLETK